jgi:hypothetical protein
MSAVARIRVVLVGSLPDATSPGIIAVASIISGFLGTTFALMARLVA